MFLKLFKDKSNQKYINRILNSRISNVSKKRIESVGVLLNLEEYKDYDALRQFLKSIGIKENKIKFIAFIEEEKDADNSWDSYYNSKEFGWNGKRNNIELEEFINTKFDVLISYYKKDRYELNVVTASSKATFKIGIASHDQRLNDFIVKIEPNQIELFKVELLKYLKVFNII